MLWAIGFLILIVALMIPVLAIVLDSPALRQVFEHRGTGGRRELDNLSGKLAALEDEVEELSRAVELLKEETQFLQRLLENSEQRSAPKSLSYPKS